MSDEVLANAISRICEDIGIAFVKCQPAVNHDGLDVTVQMPRRYLRIEIDGSIGVSGPERFGADLIDRLYDAQRRLFADVAAHMRQHDKDPHNRLQQIEAAAARLIAGLDELGLIGVPKNVRGPLEDLRALTTAAPGQVAWFEPEVRAAR